VGKVFFDQSDVRSFLDTFSEGNRPDSYKVYVDCLKVLLRTATNVVQLPEEEVKLTSPVTVADLGTVQKGQKFSLTVGDVVGLGNEYRLFSLKRVSGSKERGDAKFIYSYSNLVTNRGDRSNTVQQAETFRLDDECLVVGYDIDTENSSVSFILHFPSN